MAEQESLRAGLRPGRDRMREIAFTPPDGDLRLREARVPEPGPGEVLVKTLVTGIDGTDEEILAGEHGEAPEGEDALVLGHECLGVVVHAPPGSGFEAGDHVVPLVRHACGTCPACAHDAADMCPTERFAEHGIKGLHGFMREYWTDDPRYLVKAPRDLGALAVLAEPLSIAVKALDHAGLIMRDRVPWFEDEGGFRGKRALIAGTGSLGSLGAFLLADEGMDVWAMDRSSHDAFGARLLADVGVRHVNVKEEDVREVAEDVGGFDLVIEATGVPKVVFDTVLTLRENGVMCMLGIPPEGDPVRIDGDAVMRGMVLKNQVLFGSVNSNRRHFEEALERLGAFRDRWGAGFTRIVTHAYAPEAFEAAFREDAADQVKKVVVWSRDVEVPASVASKGLEGGS